jgi:methionyl aminopeptidase
MINMGRKEIKHLKDGWTIITADGLPSAHFEHDVAFIDGKADILSNYQIIEEAIQLTKH